LYVDGIIGNDTGLKITYLVNKNNATNLDIGQVVQLQKDLKTLLYFPADVNSTGYYGTVTQQAVKDFQKDNGLYVDGKAGNNTLKKISELSGASKVKLSVSTSQVSSVSRSNAKATDYMIPWFNQAENIFGLQDTAFIYDIVTGITYNVKRTFGHNHADCEGLTAKDTRTLLRTYDGEWSWERRAILVFVNEHIIAGSIAAMPHAGREDMENLKWVSWRSGDYNGGTNMDQIKGNEMSGVIDIHLYKSKGHASNSISQAHQKMVLTAAEWAASNPTKVEEIKNSLK